MGSCPFGNALAILLVGFPPDLAGAGELPRGIVLGCLALLVVLECLVVVRLLGALNEFGYTEKPQHTLQDMAVSLVLGFGRE